MSSDQRVRGSFTHQDIVNSILVKLPTRSLSRFLAVCKGWYDNIKSPIFCKKYLETSRSRDGVIIVFHENNFSVFTSITDFLAEPKSRPLPFPANRRSLNICGHCNGLILLKLRIAKGSLAFLWNPIFSRFKKIDLNPPGRESSGHGPYFYAVGYGETDEDVKVVRLSTGWLEKSHSGSVYNLSTNNWHDVGSITRDGQPVPSIIPSKNVVYMGTGVYWLAHIPRTPRLLILRFDFITEVFTTIDLPFETFQEFCDVNIMGTMGKIAISIPKTKVCFLDLDTGSLTERPWGFVPYEGAMEPLACTKSGNWVLKPNSSDGALQFRVAEDDETHDVVGIITRYDKPVIVDFVESLALLEEGTSELDLS